MLALLGERWGGFAALKPRTLAWWKWAAHPGQGPAMAIAGSPEGRVSSVWVTARGLAAGYKKEMRSEEVPAAAYNLANGTNKKVQLVFTGAFNSPTWLGDAAQNDAAIVSCDPGFQGAAFPGDCGMVTFQGYSEAIDRLTPDGLAPLPLPWDPSYFEWFESYLTHAAQRYGADSSEGQGLLQSVTISGPTAASPEMIMPNQGNASLPQMQFATSGAQPWGGTLYEV